MPLDLMQLYGDRYKIQLEEGIYWRKGWEIDPWTLQLLCQYGHIYPYSDEQLGYYCDAGKVMHRLMRDRPDIEVPQEGDVEAIFLFGPDQFGVVAKYAKPRRKRKNESNPKMHEKTVIARQRLRKAQMRKRGQFRPQKSNET